MYSKLVVLSYLAVSEFETGMICAWLLSLHHTRIKKTPVMPLVETDSFQPTEGAGLIRYVGDTKPSRDTATPVFRQSRFKYTKYAFPIVQNNHNLIMA